MAERLVGDDGRKMAEEAAARLKALADPMRLRILARLKEHGELAVCDFMPLLGISQPTVSHHLRILREAGFVEREKRGVWAIHMTNSVGLDEASADMLSLAPRTRRTKKKAAAAA